MSDKPNYSGKLKDSLFWWLGKKRPFYANNDYKIELLHIDREHQSVKIRVTNLKDGVSVTDDVEATHDIN